MSKTSSPSQNFDLEFTLDGSPTLRLKASPVNCEVAGEQKPPESMHHSAGAAGETQYIYGTALKKTFEGIAQVNQLKPIIQAGASNLHVLVVGLGLGYIEILAAGIKQDFPQIKLSITSYETDIDLKQNFQKWIAGSDEFLIYDEVCRHLGYEPATIKAILQNVDLQIKVGLGAATEYSLPAQAICFDAFSRKTTEELWNEEFLKKFLLQAASKDCVFTTYACTGDLKRALISQGFTFIKRPGFTQKRDSTLGLRGIFN